MKAQEKIYNAVVENACDPLREQFKFQHVDFCGEEAILVTPAIQGTSWNQVNKYFRSVIYRKSDYTVLSSGFPKFVNYGENVENFPPPKDLDNSVVISKEDGSLMIVDYVNMQLNIRTRGTVSYRTLENYKDFEESMKKYPRVESWMKEHPNISLLFEIVTPNQRIVLDYPEVDLFLIGAVDKTTLELVDQDTLDKYTLDIWVNRPNLYYFNNVKDLILSIKNMKGIEGCCLYKGGDIWKIKSDEYLKLHSFKSNASVKNIIELYSEYGFPSFDEFKGMILDEFDWECWKFIEKYVENICDVKKSIDKSIQDVVYFVKNNDQLSNKEFALLVNDTYESCYKTIAFCLRNGKDIPERIIKNKIINFFK